MGDLNNTLALSADTKTAEEFFAKHPQVKLVSLQYVNVCGVASSRLQPVQSFLHALKTRGGMHQSVADLLITSTGGLLSELLFGYLCYERGVFKPDLSTLKLCPDSAGLDNTASVVAESSLFGMDARANLRRIVSEAKSKHKLEFMTGFEIEVAYLNPQDDEFFTSAYSQGPTGLHIAGATHRSALWPVVNETTIALADAGIFVESSHKEFGSPQWEYVLPPYGPVESVDAYLFATETIKNIAHKHGLVASMYPTPYPSDEEKPLVDTVTQETGKEEDKAGDKRSEPISTAKSGQHVHISATFDGDDGRSESSSWNPDGLMSGILSHVPAICAMAMAQVDSYHRVGENVLSTGGYVGWGDQHRDFPVRRMHKNHWELRIHDATSNPYAAVAAIIGAALDRRPLTIKPTKGKYWL